MCSLALHQHFYSISPITASTNPAHAYSSGLSQRHQYHTGLRISICTNQGGSWRIAKGNFRSVIAQCEKHCFLLTVGEQWNLEIPTSSDKISLCWSFALKLHVRSCAHPFVFPHTHASQFLTSFLLDYIQSPAMTIVSDKTQMPSGTFPLRENPLCLNVQLFSRNV